MAKDRRSPCPLAALLDVLGDRWTLLVVRDLLYFGKTRFAEFEAGPEGMSTNTLADRLKRLEAHGIITKTRDPDDARLFRYALTDKGRDLDPLMKAGINWGLTHVPGTGKPSARPS